MHRSRPRDPLARDRRLADLQVLGFQATHQLALHQVSHALGILRRFRRSFELIGQFFGVREHARVVFRDAIVLDEAGAASFAIRMQYRGEERTTELPLTQDVIGQLAFLAAFRNVTIGELIGELIAALLNKDRLGQKLLQLGVLVLQPLCAC